MIPKKIYLNEQELHDAITYERMVSCNEPYRDMTEEYVNISQVWHDAGEEPLRDKAFIMELGANKYGLETFALAENDINSNWDEVVKELPLLRWAYISDLLPKGDEE